MQISQKFYLKNSNAKASPLYVSVILHSHRVQLSTGIKLNAKDWNHEKQKMKNTKDMNYIYDAKLSEISASIKNIPLRYAIKKITKEQLRKEVLNIVNPDKAKQEEEVKQPIKNLTPLVLKYIEKKWDDNSFRERTVKGYTTTYNLLREFSENYNDELDNINADFMENFYDYLTSKDLQDAYVTKQVHNLRSFINKLYEKGLIKEDSYKNFKISKDHKSYSTKTDIILNKSDLKKIKDFEPITNGQKRIKELFLFHIQTPLRVSDLFKLNEAHIDKENNLIVMKATKNRNKMKIPISSYMMDYLDQHNYTIPSMRSQHYNREVKHLCKMAGIDYLTEWTAHYKSKTKSYTVPKYERITSNIARKTYITNLISAGMNAKAICDITGHKNPQTLYKSYIRPEQEETLSTARNLANLMF